MKSIAGLIVGFVVLQLAFAVGLPAIPAEKPVPVAPSADDVHFQVSPHSALSHLPMVQQVVFSASAMEFPTPSCCGDSEEATAQNANGDGGPNNDEMVAAHDAVPADDSCAGCSGETAPPPVVDEEPACGGCAEEDKPIETVDAPACEGCGGEAAVADLRETEWFKASLNDLYSDLPNFNAYDFADGLGLDEETASRLLDLQDAFLQQAEPLYEEAQRLDDLLARTICQEATPAQAMRWMSQRLATAGEILALEAEFRCALYRLLRSDDRVFLGREIWGMEVAAAGCAGECGSECAGTCGECQSECQQECEHECEHCEGACQGECEGGCARECEHECEHCEGECERSCESRREGDPAGECPHCTGACEGACPEPAPAEPQGASQCEGCQGEAPVAPASESEPAPTPAPLAEPATQG